MKYAVFYKKLDELNGADFDEEVVNQYENITLKDVGLSCIVNGQEVITTIDNLIQDMCEKQIDYIFDAFAERITKKINEAPRQESSKEYDYSKSTWENIQEGNGISKDIPKEPKHGKWILGKKYQENIGDACVGIEYDGWCCSSCGMKIEESYKPNWNYCPNCGVKMEVEE